MKMNRHHCIASILKTVSTLTSPQNDSFFKTFSYPSLSLWLVFIVTLPSCGAGLLSEAFSSENEAPAGNNSLLPTAGSSPEGDGEACGPIVPAPAPAPVFRRLSSDQYHNTLRDLFGGSLGALMVGASTYPETKVSEGLATDAAANTVNESESRQIEDNASAMSALALNHIDDILSCGSTPLSDQDIDQCIDSFINDFGRRAYRRPLTDAETSIVRGLYDLGRVDEAASGFRSVVEFFLQSPALLYHVEYGHRPGEQGSHVVELSGYEMATRLAYFLTNSAPDLQLLSAAAQGQLLTSEGLQEQARRLMNGEGFFDSLESFHRDLFHTYRLKDFSFDENIINDNTKLAMGSEIRRYLHLLDRYEMLNFAGLFGASRYEVIPELAHLYGLDSMTGDSMEVQSSERRGLLGLPSVLAATSAKQGENPTLARSVFILEAILCQSLPSFPGDLDTSLPTEGLESTATAKDRLAPTMNNPVCQGCHQTLNPPGLALEQFDYFGRYRTEENGSLIDASGELDASGAEGSFSDSTEFLELLLEGSSVRSCYAEHWLQAAYGRPPTAEEKCMAETLLSVRNESDENLRELLVQITLTPSFRQREIRENQ
jgi:hypothetical protein